MNLTINTDGASRGNPGPAAFGYLVKDTDEGRVLHQEGGTIGVNTNNVAEYTAVLKALEFVKISFDGSKPHHIEVITDSQLIAQQLKGNYKVKNMNLKIFFDKIKKLEDQLGRVNYINVPREENFQADRLANQALDKIK